MNPKIIIPFILLIIAAGVVFLFYKPSTTNDRTSEVIYSSPPSPTPEKTEFQAKFLIFTNNTKRIFTDQKYHNRSQDVFITQENPSVVQIKKGDITWGEFFNTLPSPMKVEKDCLHTGTGQEFCISDAKTLKFYINGELNPDALNKIIREKDKLLVSFGGEQDAEIKNQLHQLNIL